MVNLFGKKWSPEDLRTRVGQMEQIAGVREYELASGNEKGVEAIDFWTGTGLRFTVLPGRGMDISSASYQGQSLCWRSSTGDVAGSFFEPQGLGWLRVFFAGMLTTCGMTYVGAPAVDNGEELGLHGRISNIPAKNVNAWTQWIDGEYVLKAIGAVREAAVFGPNIVCTRTITAKMGENQLTIHDVYENEGFRTQPFMILYHFNAGFPAVDDGSVLVCPSETWKPRDDTAADGIESAKEFHAPTEAYKEKVYFHDMKPDDSGKVHVAIINKAHNNGEGFGVYLKYNKEELPYFIQWKMMGQGEYVVGIEPGNCLVDGRPKEREAGRLQSIKPGERREVTIEVGALSGRQTIAEFTEKAAI